MGKKKLGLKQKLKQATRNISVDIFGYEKKIIKNVIRYLNQAAQEHRLPKGQVVAKIIKRGTTARVFLYHKGKPIQEIPLRELVAFFTGKENAYLLVIEAKVIKGIMAYMDEFIKFYELQDDTLQVRIVSDTSSVVISAYHHNCHIKDIPIKELINYFTR